MFDIQPVESPVMSDLLKFDQFCPTGKSRGYRELITEPCQSEPTLFIETISLGSIKLIAETFIYTQSFDGYEKTKNDKFALNQREEAKRILGDWVVKVGDKDNDETGTIFLDSTKDIVLRTPGKIRMYCEEIEEHGYEEFSPDDYRPHFKALDEHGPAINPLLSEFHGGGSDEELRIQQLRMEEKMLARMESLEYARKPDYLETLE